MAEPGRPVAIVTGGSGGIGAACATRLAEQGFDVAVAYRSGREAAERTAAACKAAGGDALVVKADISADADCRALAAAALDRWGRIDVLVNNAATTRFVRASDLDGLDEADYARVFAVNVTGTHQMIRAARAALEASPGGAVVNVSSHAGVSGIGSSVAYAASKGALNTLTLALARALAPKIRVNAVCPGFVDTPWHGKAERLQDPARMERFRDRMRETAPLERLTTAEDVADAVVWLATGARAITGVLLVVDGGTHLTVGSPL